MTAAEPSRLPAEAEADRAPAPSLRVEAEALLAAAIAAVSGGVVGLIIGLLGVGVRLWGDASLASWAAAGAGLAAAVSSALGYWRARTTDGQEWRRRIASWRYVVSTASVVIAHGALAMIGTVALFAVLSRAFINVELTAFWTTVLAATATGLSGWLSYLSASRMTTQRLTTLLVTFIGIGTLAAMITTSDPMWWTYHFSQLGTFGDMSSFLFNGTLIAGGLLVTTFTLYVSHDLAALGEGPRGIRVVGTALAIMGVMLACVGIFPVNVNMLLHNLSASGMALMFLLLLVGGPWIVRRMPRAYFLASWAFLAGLLVSIALFATGYFGLTAFEIIVFALIFGWLAVFIRFMVVADQPEPRS
ncbi:hypothetical protein HMPREF1529_00752 [Microbacterium sp. oral taxon 186 str. F0373]|jgi:hypothetical membrane protein|uniref:hypothetical protein n=1 Tax=Microbacterium sp. oral taxon 186 TaxID=712383 RepID=UPI0002587E6C|nr:hypothetical protein [Microbacterium sp. oral taxon 186]EIC06611.1 hypothetical protein OR221_0062 [Microbacterium laevaniformans OR221]EPD85740.1 hypothetical protein HMPREF1529_00752 [Microbacterium sp. oral taxon 186 str. F0373]